jgi:hypothetical protein
VQLFDGAQFNAVADAVQVLLLLLLWQIVAQSWLLSTPFSRTCAAAPAPQCCATCKHTEPNAHVTPIIHLLQSVT